MSVRTPLAPSLSAVDPGRRSRRSFLRAGLAIACIAYVAVLLLLPLIGIVITALDPGFSLVTDTFSHPEVLHAFWLTFVITVVTVVVTTFFGLCVAWVLVRQRFRGRALMNALVDLPFALSPVTVGLACVLLFGN